MIWPTWGMARPALPIEASAKGSEGAAEIGERRCPAGPGRTAGVDHAAVSQGVAASRIAGMIPLRVAAVLAHCSALVCNDTGRMHIAAAVGTSVVAVFGPTSPRVYLPRGQGIGVRGDLSCPHRSHNMNPPACWESEHCLIPADNCTAAVPTNSVIAALRTVLESFAGMTSSTI